MRLRLVIFLSIAALLPAAIYSLNSSATTPAALLLSYLPLPTSGEGCAPSIGAKVTVFQAAELSTNVPPGARVNISANFYAAAKLKEESSLLLSLLDTHGIIALQTQDNLNNKLLILPTTQWSGPISITLPLTIPKALHGTYHLLVELRDTRGSIDLTPGPNVQRDNQCRYEIGKVVVQSNAKSPNLLPAPMLNLSHYKMTFNDDFHVLSISDGPTNDGSKWYSKNEACCLMPTDSSESAMAGISDPHNPFSLIPGGGLNIRLQKTAKQWTSGVLTTVDSHGQGFSQTFGYFEMMAKFPTGENTWPAFWLLNTAAKANHAPAGEIDVVEYIANPKFNDYLATTLHDWSQHTPQPMSHYRVARPTDGFHTYGMMWTAETMTFYFDRSIAFQAPTPSIMHQPYYPIVDLGLGGGWPTKSTPGVNDMKIKYIRAWQKIPD